MQLQEEAEDSTANIWTRMSPRIIFSRFSYKKVYKPEFDMKSQKEKDFSFNVWA